MSKGNLTAKQVNEGQALNRHIHCKRKKMMVPASFAQWSQMQGHGASLGVAPLVTSKQTKTGLLPFFLSACEECRPPTFVFLQVTIRINRTCSQSGNMHLRVSRVVREIKCALVPSKSRERRWRELIERIVRDVMNTNAGVKKKTLPLGLGGTLSALHSIWK